MSEAIEDNVFDEGNPIDNAAPAAKPEGEIIQPKPEAKPAPKPADEVKPADEDNTDTGEGNEEQDAGTPPAEASIKEDEIVDDGKPIPVHRFKAALKKVTDELEATKQQLADKTKVPVPDREKEPEAYEMHVRFEASQSIMRETKPDYQKVIDHYAVLEQSNPLLSQAVAKHPIPAKLAYDIAKRDLDIKEAMEVRESDDWKEFQEFKKNKGKPPAPATPENASVGAKLGGGQVKVPNLNRATNTAPKKADLANEDDELFKDTIL